MRRPTDRDTNVAVFQKPGFSAGLHYDSCVIVSDTNVVVAAVPRATYSKTVENPPNETPATVGRTARAIELRRRLAIPETRAAVVSYLVNLYRVSRDWRNVADTAGVSHRTMSRYVHDFPELERGAAVARETWQTPNGLAGYNAARAAT